MTDGSNLAILVVDNQDMSIRAWIGGVRRALDLVCRRHLPGSTCKPFVYGLAFDDVALLPDSSIKDRPIRIGDYAPQNCAMPACGWTSPPKTWPRRCH